MHRIHHHNHFRPHVSDALATEIFLGSILLVFIVAGVISFLTPWG